MNFYAQYSIVERKMQMNRIIISGTVEESPEFSHEMYGKKFYRFFISSERISGVSDVIPVLISEVFLEEIKVGERIGVDGGIRTYNKRGKLEINVTAKELFFPLDHDENYVEIDGYLCKAPTYRETPFGREISDLLIATNRPYGRSDYIPSIVWGRYARKTSKKAIGTRIFAKGRIQSREYIKKLDNGEIETRVAYELSINTIKDYRESEEHLWMNRKLQ